MSISKKLFIIVTGTTPKHFGECYCINCFHSFWTEGQLLSHEKVWNNYDYCYLEIPRDGDNTLKYNHQQKSVKLNLGLKK